MRLSKKNVTLYVLCSVMFHLNKVSQRKNM